MPRLAIDPESKAAFNLRGYVDFYSHDYAQAVEDFTKSFDATNPQTLAHARLLTSHVKKE